MNDVLNNPTKLREFRQQSKGKVTDEQFDEYLRQKGVSEEVIEQSKLPQPTQPTTPTQPTEPNVGEPTAPLNTYPTQPTEPTTPIQPQQPTAPTQPTQPSIMNVGYAQPAQPVKPTLDKVKQVWDEARWKVTPEQFKQKCKELGFSDKDLAFVDDKFELTDEQAFESYIDRLAKKERPEDIISQDMQSRLSQDSTINDVNRAREEATRRFMNFLITRDIKNGVEFGTFKKGYFKEKYPTLSDSDVEKIKQSFIENKPDILSMLSTVGSDMLEGAEQDFLKVKKLLSYTKLIDFTEQDLAEQKRLEDLERKREIRSGAFLGLDTSDLSPLALADFMVGMGKFKTAREIATTMTAGGLLGFAQSLESGATTPEKIVSASLGAVSPWIAKGLEKSFEGFFKFLTNLSFSKDTMLKDLGNQLGDMKIADLQNFLKFADDNGYKLNIGALTQRNSQTYKLIKVAKAYKNFVDSQTNQLAYNNSVVNQAMKKTMDELAEGDVVPKLITAQNRLGEESQLVDDYVNNLLQKNIKEFETKWGDVVNKAYADSSKVASTIPVRNSNDLLYQVLSYRDKTPITLEGTPAEAMKAKLDKLIEASFASKQLSGGYTLDDLNLLSKSISSQFPMTSDRERNLIAITAKEHIAELQLNILNSLKSELDSKSVLSPVEEAIKNKIPEVMEAYAKAKEVYTTKRKYLYDTNSKEYIGKFVTEKGAEVLNGLLQGAKLEELASLKSAFKFAGKEKDFQVIGKRYIFNKINELYDPTLSKYDYKKLSDTLDSILKESDKLELFGFDKGAYDALKNMKLLANAHYNLKKIVEGEFDVGTNQLDIISRILTKIPDTLRGILVSKTIPDNKKIIKLSKQLDDYVIQINKELKKNPTIWKRIKEGAKYLARGTADEAIQGVGIESLSPMLGQQNNQQGY